jgi:threonyl-tRNA synthetase
MLTKTGKYDMIGKRKGLLTMANAKKVGAKIRAATLMKVPYQVIVGGKDEAAGQTSVRSRADGDLGAMKLADFVGRMKGETARFLA